jgi:ADP-heptose:LPS heptosyltransferase
MKFIIKVILFECFYLLKKRKFTVKGNTILVVQLSGIGDAILTLPLVESLSINNKIVILTKTSNLNIYKNQPFISKIIEYKESNFINYNNFINFFSLYNFELLVSIRSNFNFLFFALINNVKVIPNPLFERFRLYSRFCSFFSKNYKKKYYNKTHTVNIFNKYFNIKQNFNNLIPIYKEIIPNSLIEFINNEKNIIIFHFAGQDEIRKLKKEVITNIINNINIKIILLGVEKDLNIIKNIHLPNNVYNAIGLLNLNQISYLFERVNNIICVDSSIMHLASINRKMNMICLTGNTLTSYYGPYRVINSDNIIILDRKPLCSPCSKTKCIKFNGYSCVQDINSDEILSCTKLFYNI